VTEITLEFVARQLDRVLDQIGTMRDEITVLTGITMRLDGAVEGLTRALRGPYGRNARALPPA
jgi:hypothetical protein